jgi:hypothetical protein
MNRKEKKIWEKKLGLDKYKKSLTRAQRFEMMRNNIIEGNRKEAEMKEFLKIQNNKQEDDQIKNKISSRAVDLMLNEGLDYYSATEKAKVELGQK